MKKEKTVTIRAALVIVLIIDPLLCAFFNIAGSLTKRLSMTRMAGRDLQACTRNLMKVGCTVVKLTGLADTPMLARPSSPVPLREFISLVNALPPGLMGRRNTQVDPLH